MTSTIDNLLSGSTLPALSLAAVLAACGSEGPADPAGRGGQGLARSACSTSADVDQGICYALRAHGCGRSTPCRQRAADFCGVGWSAAQRSCKRGLITVHRLVDAPRAAGLHRETSVPEGGRIEAVFRFRTTPVAGADQRAIHRCHVSKYSNHGDFPSLDPACEGHAAPWSLLGYSFAAGSPGARPVYRCRLRWWVDHFLSRQANCEGHINEGLIGWAR